MKTAQLTRWKWILGVVIGAFLIYMGIRTWTKYSTGEPVTTSDLISIPILLMALMQLITWGLDSKAQRDEMGRQISAKSANISYYMMVVALFLLWIVDRIVFVRKDDLGNVTLFIALCLSLVLQPIVEFFLARRYK
ncbi:hypothetical protein DVH26_01480 [Paenibacillus sp. H1-7]|uniref:hypothetical protein n=1 Tax=Paenibacillus sp. H1-7 TaxID=2282849 RepID=UPI001EF87A35|nr:hypothetical protein [Paenibacillus sp. H1-7]ULL13265.1 hypothetical protein DVH26_01480 [Paenibacillus sp. H1-7]